MQPPIEITSSNNISASVIWLHGLGANGHDFEPVVKMLNYPHIRFILPHAPERPVSLNQGYVMPAWYDLFGLTADAKTDEDGINTSSNYVKKLIQQEVDRGIKTNRIVLAGFSQGGAVVLHTATRYPELLGGVMALSTYLPLAPQLQTQASTTNQKIPWFMAHGDYDEVIQPEIAKSSYAQLKQYGFDVIFHTYPMAHQVCEAEIDDIKAYLLQQLPIN